jgi:glycosyltransferase involved in cell wall biosynthesis
MDISIVLCTLNNAARLRQTLLHIANCRIPRGITWEVVVVNHNSRDGTEAVAREMASLLPLNYVIELCPGLSRARNCGLAAASGAMIVFTDDDVKPDPGWIETYWRAYTAFPAGQFWGGPIESEFEGGEPDWNLASLGPPSVKGLDYGREPRKLSQNMSFIAPNWAAPRAAVMAAGGFDLTLGLNAAAGNPTVGEETDLMRKLLLAGLEAWYLPAAKLRHIVPKAKVSLAHFAKRRRSDGLYGARDLPMHKVVPFLGVPRWVVRRILTDYASWLLAKATAKNGFAEYLSLCEALGLAQGFRSRSSRRANP